MAKPLQIEIQDDFFDLGLLKNWNQEKLIKKENIDSKKLLKPKPFLKWAGGKRQLINQFHDLKLLSPKNFDQKKSNYIEPFIGGGAVFFEFLPINAIIADLNEDLIKTYNTIKDNVEELIKNLKLYKNEKDFYLNIRNLNSKELSDLEIASRFIYLNKTCFNGMYRVNKSGNFNAPCGKYKNPKIADFENIKAVSNFISIAEKIYNDSKILYVSSGAVYGELPNNVKNVKENFSKIKDFRSNNYKRKYALAKIINEKQFKKLAKLGFKVSIARCFSFVGEHLFGNSKYAIADFIKSILN